MLFLYSFYTTVVNNGLHEPYLLLTNSSFTLLLSESQGMFNLGQFSIFQSKNLKASLMLSIRVLFFDKARCFSQSERALYGNFIIAELRRPEGPPSGAPYPYRKLNETHELIFSWLSWLAVLLVGAYAR